MIIKIKPTEKPGKLIEYLKPRVKQVQEREKDWIKIKTSEKEKIGRIPGIEKYRTDEEIFEGLRGKPIHREAFYQIKNREDAAKAFLATVEGYTLYIETEREWDLRRLKKYNSEIVQTERKVAEELGMKELEENFEEVSRKELLAIYDEFLTE
jgi:hypothetical protein